MFTQVPGFVEYFDLPNGCRKFKLPKKDCQEMEGWWKTKHIYAQGKTFLIIIIYSYGQKFTSTHNGHEFHGNLWP